MNKLARLYLLAWIFGIFTVCISADVPDDERPNEHLCPITLTVMVDPVLAVDGHSYERNAILEHFQRNGAKSPKTNLPLEHTSLIPNYTLKAIINDWRPVRRQVLLSIAE